MAFWSSWKRGNKPREQHYGGSEEAYKATQDKYAAGAEEGAAMSGRGVADARDAAAKAGAEYGRLGGDLQRLQSQQAGQAQTADRGFQGSMRDYSQGRAGITANAQALEADAANMKQNYQNTAQSAFNAQRDANTRSALAMGSRGGAGGLRAAMAGAINANQQAGTQAQITQAQEMNQMIGLQQNARQAAANIRSGVSAQDQAAAGQYAGRQQNALANQAGAIAQRSSNTGAATDAAQAAGQLGAQVGTAREGAYLDATANVENAALNASREAEQARLAQRSQRFNRIRDPLGIHGGT
jgi:hypothetical protein